MTNLLQTIGGLGIFLLGMIILTDGLRSLAGQSIRAALMRFTRTPLSGVITGAISTALLQSSSATTVAAVGFVSVGLLGFSEALGIIFGANIGTTITGWLVALVGFKLQLGLLALPLIFIGAVLRLFSSGKLAYTGHAIAGFGLIFVGISFLQQGMSGMQNYISFEQFPADDLLGRLQLVLMGIMFTLITQSSSAGVAASLSALFAHLINFEQAATLIIGMDIGTTVTAAFATIGGSVETRRTGYSHVIYNLFTGIGALVLISPFVWIWQNLSQQPIGNNAEIALVAFHTTFNFIGVLVVLPVTKQFARLMHKLVADVETSGTQPLDAELLNKPAQALNQLQIVIQEQFSSLLQHILFLLDSQHHSQRIDLTRLQHDLDRTHGFIDRIHLQSGQKGEWERLLAILHVFDHMQRLHERCAEETDRATTAKQTEHLAPYSRLLAENIVTLQQHMQHNRWHEMLELSQHTNRTIEQETQPYRETVVQKMALGQLPVPQGTQYLEAMRWLRRVSRHIARISQHYRDAVLAIGKKS